MISNDEKSKKIIRYLNYQKINVNLNILRDIKSINNTTQSISNFSYNQLKDPRHKKVKYYICFFKRKRLLYFYS